MFAKMIKDNLHDILFVASLRIASTVVRIFVLICAVALFDFMNFIYMFLALFW